MFDNNLPIFIRLQKFIDNSPSHNEVKEIKANFTDQSNLIFPTRETNPRISNSFISMLQGLVQSIRRWPVIFRDIRMDLESIKEFETEGLQMKFVVGSLTRFGLAFSSFLLTQPYPIRKWYSTLRDLFQKAPSYLKCSNSTVMGVTNLVDLVKWLNSEKVADEEARVCTMDGVGHAMRGIL